MVDYGKEIEFVVFNESTCELMEGVKSIALKLNKKKLVLLTFGIMNKGKVIGHEATSNTS